MRKQPYRISFFLGPETEFTKNTQRLLNDTAMQWISVPKIIDLFLLFTSVAENLPLWFDRLADFCMEILKFN
jgi:hypothetical protein